MSDLLPPFNVPDVGPVEAGGFPEFLLAHLPVLPQGPDEVPEHLELLSTALGLLHQMIWG